jgi:hypothetical protein
MVGERNALREHEQRKLEIIDKFDGELIAIQNLHRSIQTVEKGKLLATILEDQITNVRRDASTAVTGGFLEVTPALKTTKPLLSSIGGGDDCSFVHYLDNNGYFFGNPHSVDFNVSLDKMRKQKKIKKIRRLFVVNKKPELHDPFTWLLIAFHMDTRNMYHQLIDYAGFLSMQKEAGFDPIRRDFGIYGARYVYASSQDPSIDNELKASPHGRFYVDSKVVQKYTTLFDACWETVQSSCAPLRVAEIVRRAISTKAGGRAASPNPRVNSIDVLMDAAKNRSILEAIITEEVKTTSLDFAVVGQLDKNENSEEKN